MKKKRKKTETCVEGEEFGEARGRFGREGGTLGREVGTYREREREKET